VLFRCLTIVFWYHHYFWKHIAFHAHIPGMRPLTLHIVAMHALYYGLAFGLSVFGYWREVLMLMDLPAHPRFGADHLFLRLSHPPAARGA